MAEPVNDKHVPKEFFCGICWSVPLDLAILGPCNHIFCRDCIKDWLSYRKACPLCQSKKCRVNRLHYKNALAGRIWSNIVVKCRKSDHKNCGWTGSITDYKSHGFCPIIEDKESSCLIIEDKESRLKKERLSEIVESLQNELQEKDEKMKAKQDEQFSEIVESILNESQAEQERLVDVVEGQQKELEEKEGRIRAIAKCHSKVVERLQEKELALRTERREFQEKERAMTTERKCHSEAMGSLKRKFQEKELAMGSLTRELQEKERTMKTERKCYNAAVGGLKRELQEKEHEMRTERDRHSKVVGRLQKKLQTSEMVKSLQEKMEPKQKMVITKERVSLKL